MTPEINEIEELKRKLLQLYEQNYYDQAIIITRRLLDLSEKEYGERSEEYAINMSIMGSLYRKLGNYSKAEKYIKKALKIMGSSPGGENQPNYVLNLSNLAVLYQEIGDYANAEKNYNIILTISESLKEKYPEGSLNDLLVVNYSNLALLHQEIGDYAKAEEYYKKILEVRNVAQEKDKHPDYARTLSNLGEMYREMGRYVLAEVYFVEANKCYSAVNDPDYALNLNNLAVLCQQKGNYAKAEEYYKHALIIFETVLSKNHPKYATILDNLASLYREEGQYVKAEEKIKKTLEIREEVLGSKHPDYAASLENLAVLYREKGDYAKAKDLFLKALKIRQKAGGDQHPDYIDTLNNLALVNAAIGRKEEAFRFLKLAVTSEHKSLEKIFPMSSESVRISYSKIIPTFYSFLSVIFYYYRNSGSELKEALELVLKHKAIYNYISATKMRRISGRSSLSTEKLNQLQMLRKQVLVNILLLSTQKEKVGDKLYNLILNKEHLEAELAFGTSDELVKNLQNISLQSIYEALPTGTALVEFVRTELLNFEANRSKHESQWNNARYLAFVLSRGNQDVNIQLVDVGDALDIDKKIELFRKSIYSGVTNTEIHGLEGDMNERRSINESILKTIFEPLFTPIESNVNLIIAPDGELTKIPFEIIPIGNTENYYIDRFLISYVNTGSDILVFRRSSTTSDNEVSGEPLVAACPDFDAVRTVSSADKRPSKEQIELHNLSYRSLHFDPIPITEEANDIARLLGVKPLLGDSIVRSIFTFSQSPKVMHLVIPAFFLPKSDLNQDKDQIKIGDTTQDIKQLSWIRIMNPMMCCGLALAGINNLTKEEKNTDDRGYGLITGEEISEMNLSETNLIVLSASEISFNPTYTKEGLFGLGRSFKHAGAKTLIMSLWRSPDKQRIELLVDLYRRILDGQPQAESLRNAKLALKRKYPDCLHWGNLICFGNPGG
jgi:tetratricopeptide (TPR) repeat protein